MAIDHHDAAGSLDHGRVRGHQTHRARAINHYGIAGSHAGQFGGVPTGRKDVRAHDIVGLLRLRVRRQLQRHEVRPRYPEVFGLSARPWAHVRKPESAAGDSRLVRAQAKRGEAALAVDAVATAYVEREAHPVSGFDPLHRRSYLLDHAQILVTEDAALLEVRSSLVHV